VKCFGDDTCYSLAFGIPAILMAVATVIIIVGKYVYLPIGVPNFRYFSKINLESCKNIQNSDCNIRKWKI
jgi:hypothetical protein